VRGACIDIGSNTTRLLVADRGPQGLSEIHHERAFTRISRGLGDGGVISGAKIAEVAQVVAQQAERAHDLGATSIRAVATAAIRRAGNGDELAGAIRAACGLEIVVLTGEQEARLAFAGAVGTLESAPDGAIGVADVGGGSSELVVGRAPDRIDWFASLAVGSGDLADEYLRSDPPSPAEIDRARECVARALDGIDAPRPPAALAVGGSATSLRAVAGDMLDEAAFGRALEALTSASAASIARRFALDSERVRLLPAGLVVLQAAAELFGAPLRIGRGGIREGVLLEASA
jgi:exopolyphosphatase/guanosine-5'-triphosphate,3'-diphosphate pyrophosphatase